MVASTDRILRKRQPVQCLQLGPIKLSTPKKSKAEINRDYYARIKDCDEKYQERLSKQKEASKRNRHDIRNDPIKLERSRKLAAARVRKYRPRMKEKIAKEANKSPKVWTRKDAEALEKKREKERLRKRAERANWSHQKRTAENKKASDRYKSKKSSSIITKTRLQDTVAALNGLGQQILETSNRSKNARYQALHRVFKELPKEKVSRQETLDDFFKNVGSEPASLRIRSLTPVSLTRKDKTLTRGFIQKLWMSKKHNKGEFRTMKTLFGLSRSRISYHVRPQIRKRINQKQEAVQQFYLDNSRTLSEKRHSQNCQQPSSVMEEPIEELHKKFSAQSGIKVSKSFFFKHRPKQVKKMSDVKFNQSLCEVCENFRLLCKTLGSVASFFTKSKQHIVDFFLCQKKGSYNNLKCIERKCKSCQSPDVKSFFQPDELTKEVTSHQWLCKEMDRGVRRKVLVAEQTTIKGCADLFLKHMEMLPKHLFHAKWQYSMFLNQQKRLKTGELMTVMDFAENYRCSNQDEVQAAYWNYQQATIHPMVNFIKCSKCGEVETHAVIAISDDLQHDYHAVEIFFQRNLEFFKDRELDELTQWSDGCGVQYKSKGPFACLQTAPKRYGVKQVNRHFFGSRHGKNPSDGVSANVKNKASRAVRCRRAIIQSAHDLFTFLRDSMSVSSDSCERHSSRHFVYVSKDEINRESINCFPLKGTRQVHSLLSSSTFNYRNLTCLCEGCTQDMPDVPCLNSHYVNEWQSHNMLKTSSSLTEESEGNNTSTNACGLSADSSIGLLSESTLEFLEELNEGIEAEAGAVIGEPSEPMECHQDNLEKDNDNRIFPGSWVAASFPGKVLKIYLGTVLEMDDYEASVKFCRQHGKFFSWPAVEDIGWMPLYNLTPVDAPQMDARERLTLTEAAYTKYFK